MEQIHEIDVHSRRMQLQLNAPGTITGWMDLLDSKANDVVVHQTSLRCDRDNRTIWSGPILKTTESTSSGTGAQSGNDQLQITAMGWLQGLNQRMIHTGQEFQAMQYALDGSGNPILTQPTANYSLWRAQNGTYAPRGIDEATTLAYSATPDGAGRSATDAVIIFDLLDRANIDSSTWIQRGNIYGSPVQRNLTLQRFQNVGQEITQLVNVEAGCDIYVDPVTRKMHLYGPGASSSPTIPNGKGLDRRPGVKFSLPGNCVNANRSQDGTQTANRLEAIGKYGVGRADSITSQQANGLFEASNSLSEVVDINILIAFANVEVAVRQNPWTIITFTPRSITPEEADLGVFGVPRPFVDYDLGDLVYCVVDRGRFKVGLDTPQATRVFGFTLDITDEGIEKVSSISTTYQGLGGG